MRGRFGARIFHRNGGATMRPIAEDRVYKISLGMLVMMAGGLGAIIIAWTTMEIQTQANTKRLDDNDARWERVEKIAEDVAVIKDKVIRIDGTVSAGVVFNPRRPASGR